MNMTAQIEDLVTVTDQLIVLMDRETSFLRQHRHEDIRGLQVEKAELAHVYEKHLRGLRERPENLRNVVPEAVERLKDRQIAFRKTTQSNALALQAAMEANNHVLRAIARAVAELNAKENHYSRNGQAAGTRKPGISITLDQNL